MILTFLLISLTLVACGKKDEGGNQTATTPQTEPATIPENTVPVVDPTETTVEIVSYRILSTYSTVYENENNYTVWTNIMYEIVNDGNTDIHLGPGTIVYTNDRTGEETTIFDVVGYPSVVKPGQAGYYYVVHQADNLSANDFIITELQPNITKSTTNDKTFRVDNLELDVIYGSELLATGYITNDTEYTFASVGISVILFNSLHRPMAILMGYIDSIGPYEVLKFDAYVDGFQDPSFVDGYEYTQTITYLYRPIQ